MCKCGRNQRYTFVTPTVIREGRQRIKRSGQVEVTGEGVEVEGRRDSEVVEDEGGGED